MTFDEEITKFEEEVDNKAPNVSVVKVKEILQALSEGPGGGGYLSWNGAHLQEAEFNLSRYAENLGELEARADSLYSFAKDKYEQVFAKAKQDVRKEFSLTKEKFTNAEVEDEARLRCSTAEDTVNKYYEDYKYLKGTVESVQRFLLVLTHRINELQIEKRFKV